MIYSKNTAYIKHDKTLIEKLSYLVFYIYGERFDEYSLHDILKVINECELKEHYSLKDLESIQSLYADIRKELLKRKVSRKELYSEKKFRALLRGSLKENIMKYIKPLNKHYRKIKELREYKLRSYMAKLYNLILSKSI